MWAILLLAALTMSACDRSEKELVDRVNKAVAALNNHNYSNARRHLEKAHEMGEMGANDPDVNYFLGFLLLREGKASQARKHLDIAVDGDPNRPDAHLHLARAYEKLGQDREAIASLKGLFALDRGHPNGHLLAARVAQRAGDRDSQDTALRSAIADEPGFAPAYLMLSRLYRRIGAYNESVAVLNEGLRFSPDDIALLEALGLTWMEIGRADRASDVFKVAAQHPAADYSLHYNHAAVLLELGEKNKAIKELRRFIAIGKGRANRAALREAARLLVKLRKL
jgi:predicted Zn-dependent protease